jgi:ABC-type multidrug transport system fused ATPase/permease subunit
MIYKELFTDFFKQNKAILILFVVITLLTFPVESIIIPQFYGNLYSSITENKNAKKLREIGKIIMLIIGVWLVIQAFYYIKNLMISKIIPRYLVFLRKKMFIKVLENNETDYKDIKITKNISRIFDLSNEIKDFLYYVMSYLVPLLMTVVLVCGYLFFIDWKIGLVSLICLIGFFMFCYFYGLKIVTESSKTQYIFLELTDVFNDSFENLMNIYLNNRKKSEEMKLQKYLDEYLNKYNKQMNMISNMSIVTSLISVSIFAIVIGMSFWNYSKGAISGKKFITVSLIIIYFMSFLINIGSWTSPELLRLGIIKNSMPFLRSIFVNTERNYVKNPDLNGDIVFDKISYSYTKNDGEVNITEEEAVGGSGGVSEEGENKNKNIFTDFSFKIEKGKKVAILGTSGSGKTTLVKLLLRLHSIQKGNIYINGIPIERINPEDLRNAVNYVNQRTGLFQGSVIENMKYGNNSKDKEIAGLLEKYGLVDNFRALKKGVYSNVGVNGKEVSLGMQKIIMNVRGILKKGEIIVFDEPLAGLDSRTREKMISMIDDLCKGKTMVVITHDKEILRIMDKSIDLNKIQRVGGELPFPPHPS